MSRTFADRDDYWATVNGSASVGASLVALPPGDAAHLRERLWARLQPDAAGRIACTGRAHAIRGRVAGSASPGRRRAKASSRISPSGGTYCGPATPRCRDGQEAAQRTRHLHQVHHAALRQAGWDELTQLREEVTFTKGRVIGRGRITKRGKAKRPTTSCISTPTSRWPSSRPGVGSGRSPGLDHHRQAGYWLKTRATAIERTRRSIRLESSSCGSVPATMGVTEWSPRKTTSLFRRRVLQNSPPTTFGWRPAGFYRLNGNRAVVGRLALFTDYLGISPIFPDNWLHWRTSIDLGAAAARRCGWPRRSPLCPWPAPPDATGRHLLCESASTDGVKLHHAWRDRTPACWTWRGQPPAGRRSVRAWRRVGHAEAATRANVTAPGATLFTWSRRWHGGHPRTAHTQIGAVVQRALEAAADRPVPRGLGRSNGATLWRRSRPDSAEPMRSDCWLRGAVGRPRPRFCW